MKECTEAVGSVQSSLDLEMLGRGNISVRWTVGVVGIIDGPRVKCEAEHPQSSWLCSNVFLIDLCMLRTNLKVLSGANEYFRRYGMVPSFFFSLVSSAAGRFFVCSPQRVCWSPNLD